MIRDLACRWLAGVTLFTLASGGLAQSAEIGRFTSVEGRTQRVEAQATTYLPVGKEAPVSVGDAIRTMRSSKAEITFGDGSTVRLGENTQVQIQAYTIDERGERKEALIRVNRGKIRVIVAKAQGQDFIVETPNASGHVTGSDMFVSYLKSATSILTVTGQMELYHPDFPDQVMKTRPGSTTLIPPDAPPQPPRPAISLEQHRLEQETSPRIEVEMKPGVQAEQTATVSKVTGQVQILSKGATQWHRAAKGEVLGVGDEIQAGPDGQIEIVLESGRFIQLKSGSQLLIRQLSLDPQTGAREDLFESKLGRFRVVVEKLKANSKFEIQTPTAVAGIRGTVMFLTVLPNLTTAFLQGGEGYLTNPISGVTETVTDGYNASADDQGNLTDPAETPEEQQQENEGGWDPEAETYGYSEPEPEGAVLESPEPAEGAGGEGVLETPEDTGEVLFNEVPPETPAPAELSPTFVAMSGTAAGTFRSIGSLIEGEAGIETATFAEDETSAWEATLVSTTTLAPWSGSAPATLSGIYANPNDRSLFWGDIIGSGDDGGSFLGWIGGSWHSWEGTLASLYIDPLGMTGTATGLFTGTNDTLTGFFTGDGMLTITPMSEIELIPPDLASVVQASEDLPGDFLFSSVFDIDWDSEDTGSVEGELSLRAKNITGEAWGIWEADLAATYANPNDLATWSSALKLSREEKPPFLGVLTGTDSLEDQALKLDFSLYAFDDPVTPRSMSTLSGTALGAYGSSDPVLLVAYGTGTWREDPLTLTGFWGESSLYFNDAGYVGWAGEELGTIGATTSPWETSAPFVVMGEYWLDEDAVEEDEPLLWNTEIFSNDPIESDQSTIDGGAFWGYTGGIWKDLTLDGVAAALYLDPSGTAGLLTSDVSGYYFPSSGEAWVATGVWTPTPVTSGLGINAETFSDSIHKGRLRGDLAGDFEGTGSIEGRVNWGRAWFLHDVEAMSNSEPLGIFNVRLSGPDSYSNPARSTTWSSVLGGTGIFGHYYPAEATDPGAYSNDRGYWLAETEGRWEDGEIRGELGGVYLTSTQLGVLTGDVFGLFKEESEGVGTWIAEGLGSYFGMPLTLTGVWSGDSLFYNDEGSFSWAGEESGLIGGISSPWAGPAPFVVMGEYSDNFSGEEPLLWRSLVLSNDVVEEDASTLDSGAFYGYTGGLWIDDTLWGSAVAIGLDPEGNAGFLTSDVQGTYYPELELWLAGGLFTPTPMVSAEELGLNPEALQDVIEVGTLEAEVDGSFGRGEGFIVGGGTGGETAFIGADVIQDWGIYDLELEGPDSYENPEDSTIWTASVEGSGTFGDAEGDWQGRMGGVWKDGEIRGALRALYVTEDDTAGFMSGDVFGLYDAEDDSGTWVGESLGVFTEVDSTEGGEDFIKETFSGTGLGTFEGGGVLEATSLKGTSLHIEDQEWGIWDALLEGTHEGPTSPFRLALGGEADGRVWNDAWLGTIIGDWDSEELSGKLKVVWVSLEDGEDNPTAGSATGEVLGTHGDDGSWQAVGVGEWEEIATLDEAILGYTMDEFTRFVSIPITEVYASLLDVSGRFNVGVGDITGTMDTSFYGSVYMTSGIWAALLEGDYSGMPGSVDSWEASVTGTSDLGPIDAHLHGSQWADGEWLADVHVHDSPIEFAGQAGGTYTDVDATSGTFQGVGTGTWETSP